MSQETQRQILKSGERARLIPTIADTSREQRALSILLSGMTAVRELAETLLGELGQRIGARTRITAYTEVTFQNTPEGIRNRPDGLLVVNTGRKTWTALVEAKIGSNDIDVDQLADYAKLARENRVDAVLTISNQFVARPTHTPVTLSKKLPKGVEVFHWSWMHVVTIAKLLQSENGVSSDDQRYLLDEVIRFFDSNKSGISGFDQMNADWKDLVLKIQSGTSPGRSAPEVENTIGAWHQEQRDICLLLSRSLGRQVRLKLKKAHRDDPERRIREDCDQLLKEHKLQCSLDIPDAASDLDVTVDLKTRHVTCSMFLDAPDDKQKTSARVNWVLRQLKTTDDPDVLVRARWPSKAKDTAEKLSTLREDPTALQTENPKLAPNRFEIMLVRDLAGKFTGRRTFIEQLEQTVPQFYREVGQFLRAWVPPPPKPKQSSDVEQDTDTNPTTEEHLIVGSNYSESVSDAAHENARQVVGRSSDAPSHADE
ncbi:MAG: hypothetical protein WD382_04545 [Halofilum sp. (in: g-proteobacteria)]